MDNNNNYSVTDSIVKEMGTEVNLHLNIKQNVLITTEDKVFRCLRTHLDKLEKKSGWIAPAGILLTFTITFSTTKFQKTIGMSADFWQAIHNLLALASLIWLIIAIYRSAKTPSITDVIEELKSGSLNSGTG